MITGPEKVRSKKQYAHNILPGMKLVNIKPVILIH